MASDPNSKYQTSKHTGLSLIPLSATDQAHHQGQAVEQTTAPVVADSSSPKSLSGQSTATAQQMQDTIQQAALATRASSVDVKDDATVTVDHADPLDLGRHRREDISQKQMKSDYPLAKPRRMKVCQATTPKRSAPLTKTEILHEAKCSH